jgi:hypothetical protein
MGWCKLAKWRGVGGLVQAGRMGLVTWATWLGLGEEITYCDVGSNNRTRHVFEWSKGDGDILAGTRFHSSLHHMIHTNQASSELFTCKN